MAGRVVLLLLAFILSLSVAQLAGMLLGGLASVLPGALGSFVLLAAAAGTYGLQFYLSGVLFTMSVGMPWKRSAVWTWAGISLCERLAAGPGAFSAEALRTMVTTPFGVAALLASVAASAYGCWWMEQRHDEAWADRGRAMLLGFFNRQ